MATYYVDTAVGDDGNLGTSEGAGNAWATIQHAVDNVAADDKVWVKASGTYSEALDATGATAGDRDGERRRFALGRLLSDQWNQLLGMAKLPLDRLHGERSGRSKLGSSVVLPVPLRQ